MYKILIADDEKMERDLIRYLLTRDFPGRFQILEASNGEEALLFIRREKADILLILRSCFSADSTILNMYRTR